TRLDVICVHLQRLVGAYERHWYHIHLGPDGGEECSAHEGLQLSILRAPAFRKYDQGHVVLDGLHSAVQAAYGLLGIFQIYRNLSRPPQMPTHERVAKELAFGEDPELKWQVSVKHGDIQGGKMIHHVDVGFGGVDLVQALYCNRSPYGAKNHF